MNATEHPMLYATKVVLELAVQMLLEVVQQVLQILFRGIVDLNVAFATAILSHPQVKHAGAQIIVEGMNSFVTQPDLNETMQIFSDTMAKGQEDFALRTGQDFPKLAGKFFEGMFSKEAKEQAKQEAKEQAKQEAREQAKQEAAVVESETKKFFNFTKQHSLLPERQQQAEPERQNQPALVEDNAKNRPKSEEPAKPAIWGALPSKDPPVVKSLGGGSSHSKQQEKDKQENNAPLKFLEGVFGKKPKTTATTTTDEAAKENNKVIAAGNENSKTAGKESNVNTKTGASSSPPQKKHSPILEDCETSSPSARNQNDDSSVGTPASSSSSSSSSEEETTNKEQESSLPKAATSDTQESPKYEQPQASASNRSPSPVLSLWGSPFRRAAATPGKSPVPPALLTPVAAVSATHSQSAKSPVLPMISRNAVPPPGGNSPAAPPTSPRSTGRRTVHPPAQPAPEHAQPEADLILLPNFQNMGPFDGQNSQEESQSTTYTGGVADPQSVS